MLSVHVRISPHHHSAPPNNTRRKEINTVFRLHSWPSPNACHHWTSQKFIINALLRSSPNPTNLYQAASSPRSIAFFILPCLPWCPQTAISLSLSIVRNTRENGSARPHHPAVDGRRHWRALRRGCRRRPLPGLPASVPPATAASAAAAPVVLGRPVPRDRADHRLQEPQPAARTDQEDHEGRRGRPHDRRRGPRGLRQGLRDVHPRAHAPVVGSRRGEQAPHLAEE